MGSRFSKPVLFFRDGLFAVPLGVGLGGGLSACRRCDQRAIEFEAFVPRRPGPYDPNSGH